MPSFGNGQAGFHSPLSALDSDPWTASNPCETILRYSLDQTESKALCLAGLTLSGLHHLADCVCDLSH